jgi:hypothetical protein
METVLCVDFLSKIEDQLERTSHLISLVPADKLEWTPPMPKGFSVGTLLAHIMECLAGFCAVLHASRPDRLQHFLELKKLTVDQHFGPNEAQTRLGVYRDHIREGFTVINDADLSRKIPTVFVPNGEPLLNLLLINFEHLASHKYQLFIYLRMIGLQVSSSDLYHFSGQ